MGSSPTYTACYTDMHHMLHQPSCPVSRVACGVELTSCPSIGATPDRCYISLQSACLQGAAFTPTAPGRGHPFKPKLYLRLRENFRYKCATHYPVEFQSSNFQVASCPKLDFHRRLPQKTDCSFLCCRPILHAALVLFVALGYGVGRAFLLGVHILERARPCRIEFLSNTTTRR